MTKAEYLKAGWKSVYYPYEYPDISLLPIVPDDGDGTIYRWKAVNNFGKLSHYQLTKHNPNVKTGCCMPRFSKY